MWDHSIVELFFLGGVVMWPLLFCSILGLAIILERSLVLLWKSVPFRSLLASVEPLVRAGQVDKAERILKQSASPAAQVGATFLHEWERPKEEREELVAREASQQFVQLEKRMGALAMVTSVSPLLGLLGTVTGLVEAFHQIQLKGGQVQPGDLAAGIWEALLTTVFGLVIAVPCQMAFHILDRRIASFQRQMEWITSYLEEWLSEPVTRQSR